MKEKIMAAAILLFSKYGYKKTTVEDIAGALQMTKGSIYRYFANKEDLYHQAVSQLLDDWREFVQKSIAADTQPLEKLLHMAEVAIHYPETNPDFCAIVLADPAIFSLSPGKDHYRAANRPAEELLHAVLNEGVAAGVFRDLNIEYTTELLYSIYMMHLIKIYGNGEGQRGFEVYMNGIDLLLNGLKK